MTKLRRSTLSASLNRLPSLLLAVITAGAISLPASLPSQAAVGIPGHGDMTRTAIMEQAAAMAALPATSVPQPAATAPAMRTPLLAANAYLQREVFGFVNAGNLGNPFVGYTTWDMRLLTTVAFFGLHVNSGDGNLVTNDTGWAVFHSATMSSFVRTAHSYGVRVIVSLNLHDFSANPGNQTCVGLVGSHAQATISQVVAQVAAAGIDGVNMDYEGTNTTCANGLTSRDEMTAFVRNLRAAMPSGYIAIDTYTGSAEDNLEFFDVTGLAPYVDSFFVMAYDMDMANYSDAPLNCASYCFNPMSPLNTYRFNVTSSMAQYKALVPASKIILGQPYYGRSGCVWSPVPAAHELAIVGRPLDTPTYQNASTVASTPGFTSYVTHRDPGDGVSEWDTFGETGNCTRVQIWDDTASLGAKYYLVNQDNLRGVGLFTLDYAGGAPELWNELATHFSHIPGVPGDVNSCAGNASATVSWTPAPTAGGPITGYQIVASPGGATVAVSASATLATVTGLTPGTTYTFLIQGINSSGPGVGATTAPVVPSAAAPVYTGYFNWFDNVTGGMLADNIHVMNPGVPATTGCATLSGRAVVPFNLAFGQEQHMTFPHGGIGGPVTVTADQPVLATQRVQYYSSFNEVWAMTAAQAATVSYINWFDSVTPGMTNDNIHILNPGGASANVTVSLAGASPVNLTVAAGQESYATFPAGHIGGPVTITSTVPVLASQRVLYFQSFNEVAARSAGQASMSSYFNWFDRATPGMNGDNIHILNPGGATANVTVSLAGGSPMMVSVGAGTESYVSFGAGRIGGPVTVVSSQPVLATQRVQFFQSFNEVSSFSAAQAVMVSHIMWFDRATPGMDTDNIHVVNPGGTIANVTITLPGASPVAFTVGPAAEAFRSFLVGHIGGPVTITSDQQVLAAQRVQYFQSFNEIPAG